MALSQAELDERARRRAVEEHLRTWELAGQDTYLVKSRLSEPGSMHQVTAPAGQVTSCTCKGWYYRRSCTHAQAVLRRLERETRKGDQA
jgi:hypothetical protein